MYTLLSSKKACSVGGLHAAEGAGIARSMKLSQREDTIHVSMESPSAS